jgi:hypothetical protein
MLKNTLKHSESQELKLSYWKKNFSGRLLFPLKNKKEKLETEREGFEPPVTVKPRQFSKLVQLTTLPPFL